MTTYLCNTCGGTGKVLCDTCGGTGYYPTKMNRYRPCGCSMGRVPCPSCGGTRRVRIVPGYRV